MRGIDVIARIAFVIAFCAVALGAPVLQENKGDSARPRAVEIDNQEKELENLITLAHQQADKNNAEMQTIHESSIENHNGHSVKTEKTEEKVVNIQDGSVVADVKQEVKEVSSGQGAKPEAVVETEVDIPSAGVHQNFVQKSDDDVDESANENTKKEEEEEEEEEGKEDTLIESDVENQGEENNNDDTHIEDAVLNVEEDEDEVVGGGGNDLPLTTQDMAEYLFVTQQFGQFLPTLDRLINMSKITVEDAANYAKAVIEEYEKLNMAAMRQANADKRMSNYYPAPVQPTESDLLMNEPVISPDMDVYEYQGYLSPEEQYFLQQGEDGQVAPNQYYSPQQQYLMDTAQIPNTESATPMDPLDFMAVLYDAAFGRDNPEAQELIQMLYDRVSQDDNPDDLGQIKDILLEMITHAMYQNELDIADPLVNDAPAFDQDRRLSPQGMDLMTSSNFGNEHQLGQEINDVVENVNDDSDDEIEKEIENADDGDDDVDDIDDDVDDDDDSVSENGNEESEEEEVGEKEEDEDEKDLEDQLSSISEENEKTEKA